MVVDDNLLNNKTIILLISCGISPDLANSAHGLVGGVSGDIPREYSQDDC